MIGKISNDYKILAKKLGLLERITFSGKVSHEKLPDYYSISNLHVLPSINVKNAFEGFGLVHLEANACGIPTIGSLYYGNEDVIMQEYNVFLCQQKDVNCLVDTIAFISKDGC
jgi:glycosyltransferase involved in cell wall biosynthesis